MFTECNTHYEEVILIYITTKHKYTTLQAAKKEQMHVLNIIHTKIFYIPLTN
jgi:hypothetical protein